MRRRAFLPVLLVPLCGAGAAPADEALWALLRGGGQVVLVRHALTDPGVGDPPGFDLDQCSTQRNLSESGRREAEKLGQVLRARGVPVTAVLTSPWCRCRETARLAFGREAKAESALGNLYGRPNEEAPQVAKLRQLVRPPAGGGNLFLVTHGSTIQAVTGISPDTTEMVVLTPEEGGGFRVAGRIPRS